MKQRCRISVIIPSHNGRDTIGQCLAAVYASRHDAFEVIVVDDGSTDGSAAIIAQYPCRLICLPHRAGAAAARNAGAAVSQGDLLFFTDADCLVLPDTLAIAEAAAIGSGPQVIVGGTYTQLPADLGFFSRFQSMFIHYSELKKRVPDYVATHAMVMDAAVFRNSGGFKEDFLPILEDVEFSHRLRRRGFKLRMDDRLMVRHLFNFSLRRSLVNGFFKSRFWTIYSLGNHDLFRDSGTASMEVKLTVILFFIFLGLFIARVARLEAVPAAVVVLPLLVNLFVSRRLFSLFAEKGGRAFAIRAGSYFMFVYPLAVGAGAITGLMSRKRISLR